MNLRADILAKILVMQSMLREMPDEETTFSFLCRGLKEVPGVEVACCGRFEEPASEGQCSFSLRIGDQNFGELRLRVSDPDAFAPYHPYMSNLSFMVAVILEERRLRLLNEHHRQELEARVQERTRELQQQVYERKAAELDALEAKRRAEKYLEVSEAVIVELDAEGIVKLINKRGCDLLGYSSQEIVGQNWFELMVPEADKKGTQKVFSQVMAGDAEPAEYFENPVLSRDGKEIFIAWHNTSVYDQDGRIVGTLSSGIDLSARKWAENALADEKERLRVTLHSIGDGVITTDTSGNVVMMNRVAEELTGWALGDAEGMSLDQVFPLINEVSRESCENPTDRVLRTGQVVELANHTLLISRDGIEHVIADSAAPIRDREGKIIGVVLVFRDMTERRKLLDHLQRTDRLDSLSVLAGGIAHDFNNLLGGIFGYLDLAMLKSVPGSEVEQSLEKSMSVCGRAKDLTQQLLTFAKGGEPIRKVTSIADLVPRSATFALSGSHIAWDCQVEDDLNSCNCDENQIGQVLDNLLINAKQSMPGGGQVKINCSNTSLLNHPPLPDGDYIQISVTDSGCGMSPEVLTRIFDPFFTTKKGGNGLGLATCYSIIQRHDGHIEISSEPGMGSTFTVYLPAIAAKPETATAVVEDAATHTGSGKILVMDDIDFLCELLSELLNDLGYETIRASEGDEALHLFRSNELVAAFLDLTIPGGKGGREVIQEIRQVNPDLPVFAVSGYSDDSVIARPADFGFTDSIQKPFRSAEVQKLLNTHCRQA